MTHEQYGIISTWIRWTFANQDGRTYTYPLHKGHCKVDSYKSDALGTGTQAEGSTAYLSIITSKSSKRAQLAAAFFPRGHYQTGGGAGQGSFSLVLLLLRTAATAIVRGQTSQPGKATIPLDESLYWSILLKISIIYSTKINMSFLNAYYEPNLAKHGKYRKNNKLKYLTLVLTMEPILKLREVRHKKGREPPETGRFLLVLTRFPESNQVN